MGCYLLPVPLLIAPPSPPALRLQQRTFDGNSHADACLTEVSEPEELRFSREPTLLPHGYAVLHPQKENSV